MDNQRISEVLNDIIMVVQLLKNDLENAEEDEYIIKGINVIENMLKQLNDSIKWLFIWLVCYENIQQ